ncbi:hypothetical protein [Pedococcus sp. 5OH_020]|uniref:hypothetical protein n=1 Tax=Pedococcus sp. 5OH_020 TaxID=2989814 RepID=UPI0022EA06AB|nr:hypothetical protein [Pedococcus sp. 5OH_020]
MIGRFIIQKLVKDLIQHIVKDIVINGIAKEMKALAGRYAGVHVEVKGSEDFYKASRALKGAGPELRKRVNAEIRTVARPMINQARAAARAQLPHHGGLAAQVASEPMRVQIRTGADTAGVRIVVGRRRGGAQSTNRGVIRHPVYGNRNAWVTQRVQPGWFDDSMKSQAPAVRRAIERAMEQTLAEIVRKAR